MAPPVTSCEPTATSYEDRRSANWDVQFGAGNYVSLLIWQGISSLLSFASVWLATRALGATGYGGVVAIVAASQCVQQLAVNWTTVATIRYGCEEFVTTGRISKTFWTQSLILTPYIAAILASSSLWLRILAKGLHIPASLGLLVLLMLMAMVLSVHVQYALRAAKLPRLQGLLNAVERGVICIAIAGLMITHGASVRAVTVAYIAGPMTSAAVGLLRLRKLIYPGIGLDWPLFRRMLRFSLPLLPAITTGYFSTNYLDAFFIQHYLTSTDLAFYAVAYQFAGTIMQVPVLTGSLLLPFFVTLQVQGREDQMRRYLNKVLPLIAVLWSLACALAAFAGVVLVPLVFGRQYLATANLLWPLVAASGLAGPVLMGYAGVSNTLSATYMSAVSAGVAAAMNVVLDAVFIPRFGLSGCAWATTLAYFATLLAWTYLVRRRISFTVLPVVAATAPMLVAAWTFTLHGGNIPAVIAALTTGGLVGFFSRANIREGLRTLHGTGIMGQLTKLFSRAAAEKPC